jgi:hypothetical protein
MKKFILGLVSLLFSINLSVSQNINLVSLQKKEKIEDSYNSAVKFIGNIDNSTYILVETGLISKILKLDNENMELMKIQPIKGYIIKNGNPMLKKAQINKIFITNDKTIRVFWLSQENNYAKILYSEYDQNLQEIKKPQLVHQLPNNVNYSTMSYYFNAKMFVLSSLDGEKFVVGGEESSRSPKNLSIQYKIYNKDMNVENSFTIELPYIPKSEWNSFDLTTPTANYKLSNNGDLYYYTGISLGDTEERKNKSERGSLLGKVSAKDGENSYQIIAFDNKNTLKTDFVFFPDYVMVFGLYYSGNVRINSNIAGKTYIMNYGIFSVKLDTESLEAISDIKFSLFDESKVASTNFIMTKNEKSKYTPEKHAIKKINSSLLEKENNVVINNNEILLVFSSSIMPTYYTGNIFVKLNSSGDIDWISCVQAYERSIRYDGYAGLVEKSDYMVLVDRGYREQTSSKIDSKLNSACFVDKKTGKILVKPLATIGKNEKRHVSNNEMFVLNNQGIQFTFGKYNID